MTSMIEKVANAFWLHMTFGANSAHFSAQPKEIKDHYRQAAKVAIEAMKEPTEEMLNAFGGHYGFTPSENRDKAKPIYQAVIDAALK